MGFAHTLSAWRRLLLTRFLRYTRDLFTIHPRQRAAAGRGRRPASAARQYLRRILSPRALGRYRHFSLSRRLAKLRWTRPPTSTSNQEFLPLWLPYAVANDVSRPIILSMQCRAWPQPARSYRCSELALPAVVAPCMMDCMCPLENSALNCAASCDRHAQCVSYVYVAHGGRCYLHNHTSPPARDRELQATAARGQ